MKQLTNLLLGLFFGLWVASTAVAGEDKNDENGSENVVTKQVKVTVEDGKLTIDTGDGPREIELSELGDHGHVKKIIKKIAKDSDDEAVVHGHAVMIDDEGNRRVINLGDGGEGHNVEVMVLTDGEDDEDGEHHRKKNKSRKVKRRVTLPGGQQFEFRLDGDGPEMFFPEGGPRMLWMPRGGNHWVERESFDFGDLPSSDYMIGIELQPIGDMVRAQLDLDDEVGIGVGGVMDGTPAESAGLQRFDIIVSANGETLDSFAALIDAVSAAGEAEESVSLGIIRGGERREVEVTPTRRTSSDQSHEEIIVEREEDGHHRHDGEGHHGEGHHGSDDDGDGDEDDDREMEQIRAEIKSLREALKSLRKELRND